MYSLGDPLLSNLRSKGGRNHPLVYVADDYTQPNLVVEDHNLFYCHQ